MATLFNDLCKFLAFLTFSALGGGEKKKIRLQQYRTYEKFLGILNTPEVFIAEAGHVSGARRQKFEITCSDVRILRHTCAALFLSLPQFLVLIFRLCFLSFLPLFLLSHSPTLSHHTLSAATILVLAQNSANGVCEWCLGAYGCIRG